MKNAAARLTPPGLAIAWPRSFYSPAPTNSCIQRRGMSDDRRVQTILLSILVPKPCSLVPASMIEARHLTKTFSVVHKEPGLAGAIQGLFRRKYRQVYAVQNINFLIKEGELVGFLGPNGAGKTTTLKMLSGLLHPTSGEAHVMGHVPWKRERAYQMQLTMVMGQRTQLWWDLPAWDSFLLNKEIYEIPQAQFDKTVEELAKLLEIQDLLEIPVKKLSLGQ